MPPRQPVLSHPLLGLGCLWLSHLSAAPRPLLPGLRAGPPFCAQLGKPAPTLPGLAQRNRDKAGLTSRGGHQDTLANRGRVHPRGTAWKLCGWGWTLTAQRTASAFVLPWSLALGPSLSPYPCSHLGASEKGSKSMAPLPTEAVWEIGVGTHCTSKSDRQVQSRHRWCPLFVERMNSIIGQGNSLCYRNSHASPPPQRPPPALSFSGRLQHILGVAWCPRPTFPETFDPAYGPFHFLSPQGQV